MEDTFLTTICAIDEQTFENFIIFLKRFIDDYLIFWTGSEEQLLKFMTKLNSKHPTIKFTCSYNLEERSTNFLDLKITVTDDGIITDLYRKETDRIQYLLPSSCHPAHTFNNIPYSLALRLVRICSEKKDLVKRFKELKEMLLSRGYNRNIVEAAIKRASLVDRKEALKRVEKVKTDRAVFAITYNPMLPSITKVVSKHWQFMTQNKYIKEIFPLPPMVAYKQHDNLKKVLCRAKLPTIKLGNEPRKQVGMKRCTISCNVCIYYDFTKTIKSKTGVTFPMTTQYGCQTSSVIYLASCSKCKSQYVGQSGRRFYDRIMEHLRYIRNGKHALGEHFAAGCDSKYLLVKVIEKVTPDSEFLRLQREKYWIHRLETKTPRGMNTMA